MLSINGLEHGKEETLMRMETLQGNRNQPACRTELFNIQSRRGDREWLVNKQCKRHHRTGIVILTCTTREIWVWGTLVLLNIYCLEYNWEQTVVRVPGGYFRNFWVGMCRWDPGTLNLYQSQFSWILLPYTRVNSPNPPYPRVAVFQKLPRSLKIFNQQISFLKNDTLF